MQLFVLTPDISPSHTPRLTVNSSSWGLIAQHLSPSTAPSDFTCVSYSWGLGRVPCVFHPSQTVSDRTIPVISTVLRQRPSCKKLWVDAFCVPSPSHPIERTATLESMGFIYSRAEEVIVVLTKFALPALERISHGRNLTPSDLAALEDEDWGHPRVDVSGGCQCRLAADYLPRRRARGAGRLHDVSIIPGLRARHPPCS